MNSNSYQIKLPHFEGPFDLLLFFLERDELDIYNIPIHQITKDFLDYIQQLEILNIELASEFILFASTLMRIKAKMLLPRKEKDEQGNEIDPRAELVEKLLEYKRFKEVAAEISLLESARQMHVKRGNVAKELEEVGKELAEGNEINHITLFKLMSAFEKAMKKYQERLYKPQHVVVKYNYSMEGQRAYLLSTLSVSKKSDFDHIFSICHDRIHAVFTFLAILELVQQKYLKIAIGSGANNFYLEYLGNTDN